MPDSQITYWDGNCLTGSQNKIHNRSVPLFGLIFTAMFAKILLTSLTLIT